jgi:hypothetical protein
MSVNWKLIRGMGLNVIEVDAVVLYHGDGALSFSPRAMISESNMNVPSIMYLKLAWRSP